MQSGEDMRVGWIGLGKMGLPMARRVREAGFELAVFDLIVPSDAIMDGVSVRRSVTDYRYRAIQRYPRHKPAGRRGL